MAAADEQQQRPQAASPIGENAAHVANQLASKSAQKRLENGVEKAPPELDTTAIYQTAAKEAATELRKDAGDAVMVQLRGEGSVGSVGAEPAAGDGEEEIKGKNTASLAEEDVSVPMDVDAAVHKEEELVKVSVEVEEQVEVVGESRSSAESGERLQVTKPTMESDGAEGAKSEGVDEAMEVDGEAEKETVVEQNTYAGGATSLPVEEIRSQVVAEAGAAEKAAGHMVETVVVMEVDSSEKEAGGVLTGATNIVGGGGESTVLRKMEESTNATSQGGAGESSSANGGADKAVGMDGNEESHNGTASEATERPEKKYVGTGSAEAGARLIDAEVTEVVGQIVNTLVDNVVEFMNETLSIDAESVKLLGSPMMPHLSADEAMELLEAHQGDDHELNLEHDDGADADVEAELSGNPQYQWFDGDDDDDDGVTIVPASALDDVTETTDDVFGFGVVDLTGVTPPLGGNAAIDSDGSGNTVVIPSSIHNSSSSSSSSASSASSGSSSSSSSSSASSASEDESVRRASKKRHASCGPRKLLKYKKQKRVRSSEPERKRHKRKRKIPPPVIPSEFNVFNTEAADPVLRGTYSVRNNRRACFVGHWGFSEEAFHNIESVSPFEYTSRTRVPQSRRKDDKRPISGKYGGFFKLRQFNGALVKIREDQVDLQFLPMPASDEEDEDEDMEVYESDDDDGDESAATRYTVLGKGKNRFGRFLIRGYLNPESGRLTVKRRYLE